MTSKNDKKCLQASNKRQIIYTWQACMMTGQAPLHAMIYILLTPSIGVTYFTRQNYAVLAIALLMTSSAVVASAGPAYAQQVQSKPWNWSTDHWINNIIGNDSTRDRVKITVGMSGDAIENAINSAKAGSVIGFEEGIYHDKGVIKITKANVVLMPGDAAPICRDVSDEQKQNAPYKNHPNCVQPDNRPGYVFTGKIAFDIRADGVGIHGLTFRDVETPDSTNYKAPIAGTWNTYHTIRIEANNFENTQKNGIYFYNNGKPLSNSEATFLSQLTVRGNTFTEIGYKDLTSDEKTALDTNNILPAAGKVWHAIKIEGIKDSYIAKNKINKTTGSAIVLDYAQSTEIRENDIDKIPTNGITIAKSESGNKVNDNDLTDTAYATKWSDGSTGQKELPHQYSAIGVWKADNIEVKDNKIDTAPNGIMYCECNRQYTKMNNEHVSMGATSGNTFTNIKDGGKNTYMPLVASPNTQTTTATMPAPTCSITLANPNINFNEISFGKKSGPGSQTVNNNNGNQAVTGMVLDASEWTTDGGETVSNAYSEISIPGKAGYPTRLSTDNDNVNVIKEQIGLGGNLAIEYWIDMREVTGGSSAGKTLTQTVTYLATCS